MDYLEINRQNWNKRTPVHLTSEMYDLQGFKKGKTSLCPITRELLEDLQGKSLLHLQCHFGQDTLSLERLGANVTGIDLSDQAIEAAENLRDELGMQARFIRTDLYSLPEVLDEQFDVVFTSYGTVGWLPDPVKWAKIVARYLKPGGKFYFIEFHPVVWMFDDDLNEITYPYSSEKDQPIEETEEGTYADRDAGISTNSVGWNHSISDILGALLGEGLKLQHFQEYDFSTYDVFPNMEKVEDWKYRVKKFGNKLPLVYSMVMEK